jgi:hypothetical protein
MAQRKKGRESRAAAGPIGPGEGDDDGAALIAVPLDEGQLSERRDELVSFLIKQEMEETKKGEQVKKINASIKLCKERVRVLAREIDSREAFVDRQQALDFQTTSGRRVGAAAQKAAELAGNDTTRATSTGH